MTNLKIGDVPTAPRIEQEGHAEATCVRSDTTISSHRLPTYLPPFPNDVETCEASSTNFGSKQRRIDRLKVAAHYRRDSPISDSVSVEVEILSTRQSLSTFIYRKVYRHHRVLSSRMGTRTSFIAKTLLRTTCSRETTGDERIVN